MTQVEPYSPRRSRRAPQHSGQNLPPVPPSGPWPADHSERRGSHATLSGDGFGWVTTWTIIGALIPGSGLVAAGRRRIGGLLLLLVGLALAAGAAMFAVGNPVDRAISLAVDTRKLMIMTAVVAVVALAWAAVILLTHGQLRRFADLSQAQKAFSGVLVVALIAAIGLPAVEVGRYALIQRGLVEAITTDEGQGTRPDASKPDPWADTPRMNVLLVGSDAGRDRTGVRPDTLILASIDTKSGNTVLFSLPRNLERVPFPIGTPGNQAFPGGYWCADESCLLNAIWTWAEGDGRQYYKSVKHPGLVATEQAVEGVTGLHVDTYAMLNLQGFAQFINAIGGLRVNIDERLPMGGNSEHPTATHGYLEPGRNQKLDGFQSLWYARSRWSTNDYDRMRRQRCVIGAVVKQADPKNLALQFPAIAKAAKNNISSGIAQGDLEAWVDLTERVQKAKVTSLPFTNDVIHSADPDYDLIHSLVAKAIKKSVQPATSATPAPAGSTVGTPGATQGTGTTKTPKAADPTQAQDVSAVC